MEPVYVADVGRIGLVKDIRPHYLAPEAWTTARNVRFAEGEALSIGGREQVFGDTPITPKSIAPITIGTKIYWVYAGNLHIYTWDGDSHEKITRKTAGSDVLYNASTPEQWNWANLGGILIANNGVDVPQRWPRPDGAVNMTDLPNWPATYRAKVVRAFGPFLVAIHITKGTDVYPHMILWSHPAVPGSVPSSWDIADPAMDAGETELADVNSGVLREALSLRGQLILYKESATHRMRWIGGNEKFAFDSVFDTVGILAARCVDVLPNGAGHFLVTQDDIIVHNGQDIQSVMENKLRAHVFSTIDSMTYPKSFVFAHPYRKEVFFCYPEVGHDHPNRAVIWNQATGTISETDVDFTSASTGSMEGSDLVTWADAPDTWGTLAQEWSAIERRKTLVTGRGVTEIWELDEGTTFHGDPIEVTLAREGLSIVGTGQDGKPASSLRVRKMANRVRPEIIGGPVKIRLGKQEKVGGPIIWGTRQTFDPAAMDWIDLGETEGRLIAIEFYSNGADAWSLGAYSLEVVPTGEF